MSKVMRSGKPASAPTAWAPTTPVDGPDSTVRTGMRAAVAKPMTPPFDWVRCGVAVMPSDSRRGLSALDVARHHRSEIGVQHHGRQPLELAELRRDLVAGREEGVGQLLAQDRQRALLVLGTHEAVEEGHGDRLHAGCLQRACGGAHPLSRRAACRSCRRGDALGDLEAQVARHQGQRLVGLQVVEVGPLLAADLQQVAEALGGDQPRLHAAMLDQRIGRHRRAVAEIDDGLGRTRARQAPTRRMPCSTPSAMPREGSSGVDGTFQTSTRPLCLVEQADIGEGPARIDPDAPALAHCKKEDAISYALRQKKILLSGARSRWHAQRTKQFRGRIAMRRLICLFFGVSASVTIFGTAIAADLNPAAVAYVLPDKIEWKQTSPGARQAVLAGDPSKPGLYVVMVKWLPGNMSRPHFHPNDRFITVLKGTWWMGTGTTFDPASTVPVPAGTFVTHFGKQVHYDGAKDEETVLLITGEGPATSTPAEKK